LGVLLCSILPNKLDGTGSSLKKDMVYGCLLYGSMFMLNEMFDENGEISESIQRMRDKALRMIALLRARLAQWRQPDAAAARPE
jgi:hypothetical protein